MTTVVFTEECRKFSRSWPTITFTGLTGQLPQPPDELERFLRCQPRRLDLSQLGQ